ncbi:uncharacterized protein K444DRAFT_588556 [Hyaloscypha bicolor E]|uniref:Uncharacterized protein n=1 Tax=Hyaloscypha bicolor E TaxID=1095630 RepID=A0A2J6TDJ7_9HELO|nr:uncharacterized protein K444DRAFT_588556 [Hyaloscypha bicolor E]PMD61062.1 hypothetical protein K444DRAFT_588556 [Hyaloscypha bicolor E]
MKRIVIHWDSILKGIERIIDGHMFMYPEKLQATFVENESFSQSRKFYWAIKSINEFVKYLSDDIQQWKLYREARVARFIVPKTEHFRIAKNMGKPWYSVKAAGEAATTACEELEGLRRRFESRLEEVKVMRDGLFNASAVIESRSATRLGENVMLLTYITIFFLPLAFCMSVWSINEAYGRKTLAWVSVLVALATYLATFNLNNVVRILRGAVNAVYEPRKTALVLAMVKDEKIEWRDTGKKFEAYRLIRPDDTPSEWNIPLFALRKIVRGFLGHFKRRGW